MKHVENFSKRVSESSAVRVHEWEAASLCVTAPCAPVAEFPVPSPAKHYYIKLVKEIDSTRQVVVELCCRLVFGCYLVQILAELL
jgi:hypothetical protein